MSSIHLRPHVSGGLPNTKGPVRVSMICLGGLGRNGAKSTFGSEVRVAGEAAHWMRG